VSLRTCEICGKRPARFVCQECGRQVCEVCFDPKRWLCIDCSRRLTEEIPSALETPFLTPFKLFFIGFAVIFAGMIVLMGASILSGTLAGTGGFVWIFPLPPIVFGSGQEALWVALIAIVLLVPLMLLLLFTWKALTR